MDNCCPIKSPAITYRQPFACICLHFPRSPAIPQPALPMYRTFAQNSSSTGAVRKSLCCFVHCVQILFEHGSPEPPVKHSVLSIVLEYYSDIGSAKRGPALAAIPANKSLSIASELYSDRLSRAAYKICNLKFEICNLKFEIKKLKKKLAFCPKMYYLCMSYQWKWPHAVRRITSGSQMYYPPCAQADKDGKGHLSYRMFSFFCFCSSSRAPSPVYDACRNIARQMNRAPENFIFWEERSTSEYPY